MLGLGARGVEGAHLHPALAELVLDRLGLRKARNSVGSIAPLVGIAAETDWDAASSRGRTCG